MQQLHLLKKNTLSKTEKLILLWLFSTSYIKKVTFDTKKNLFLV